MYNEELKNDFIHSYVASDSSRKADTYTFNRAEKYEEKYNRDICQMSREQLIDTASNVAGVSDRSRKSVLVLFRKYIRFCSERMETSNAISDVKPIDLNKMVGRVVASPEQLEQHLDEIYAPVENETVSCVERAYYWLLFAGIRDDTVGLMSIKSSAINLAEMTVDFKGREFPIYKEAIPSFVNCIRLTEFRYYNPNYSDVISRDRAVGDELLRGLRGVKERKSFKSKISMKEREAAEKRNEMGVKGGVILTPRRTWYSGIFYRAFEDEQNGIEVTPESFKYCVDMISENIKEERGYGYKLDSIERELEASYMTDYISWKNACFG